MQRGERRTESYLAAPQRRLRVAMFTYTTKPRGSVICAAELAEALIDRGHDVTLFALHKDEQGFFRDVRCRLELVPAGPAPSELDGLIAQRIGELQQYLRGLNEPFDIYHGQDCLVTNALAERPGCRPLVRTLHHVERFESPYLTRCQARSVQSADRVIAVSERTQRELSEQFGISSCLVRNGVRQLPAVSDNPNELGVGARATEPTAQTTAAQATTARTTEPTAIQTTAPAAVRTTEPGPIVLSLGGIEARKNSLRCLEAFVRFRETHPDAEWWIVGGASVLDHSAFQRAVFEKLQALPSEDRAAIRLLGVAAEDELARLYQAADLFLQPSTLEGWGLAVLEAMSAGLPVVTSDESPFTEYLDRSCAELVVPDSSEAIALGLKRAWARRTHLSEAGRARASRFTWQAAAEQTEGIYRTLLAARQPTNQIPTKQIRSVPPQQLSSQQSPPVAARSQVSALPPVSDHSPVSFQESARQPAELSA